MKTIILSLLIAYAAFSIEPLIAEENTIKTMATIMMELNHFPNDDQSALLTGITSDPATSDAEKAVATAILTMKHQVTAHHKQTLGEVAGNDSLGSDIRGLASIMQNVNHTLNDFEQAQLKAIVANAN